MAQTNHSQPAPHTSGRLIHHARGYDLLVWLLLGGRERRFREKLLQLARLEPGESVLDVGCGTGSLAIAAKKRVGNAGTVNGIDAAPEMIERANQKARKANLDVTFTTGVVEALPYPDAHFDVVLSTLMLHHLPRAAREQCAREIRRVLAPGGRVLAVDFGQGTEKQKGIIAHLHRHGGVGLNDMIKLMGNAGCEIMQSGAVGMRGLNFVLARAR